MTRAHRPLLALVLLASVAGCAPEPDAAPEPGAPGPGPAARGTGGARVDVWVVGSEPSPTAPEPSAPPPTAGDDGGAPEAGDMALPLPSTSAQLSWTPPTMNEDGTPLTDLGGYFVYRGLVSPLTKANFAERIDVGNVATYTFTNLAPGTHYFSVATYTTAGVESVLSTEASKTITP
jgi:hypothetical protein